MTQDGINIQDNFIRTNSVDFVPNRPTSDNVGEFSIHDGPGRRQRGRRVPGPDDYTVGHERVQGKRLRIQPQLKFAENTFFNKRSNLPVSYLNRNQFGGSIGGPIVRQKLFFYANYEAFRQHQQAAQNYTIPARSDLLTGEFRYVATDGSVRTANVLQLAGQTIDQSSRARSCRSIRVRTRSTATTAATRAPIAS